MDAGRDLHAVALALDGEARALAGGAGSSITSPRPPQRGQGWLIEKKPWLCWSTPRPSHRGQTIGRVPSFAPLPPQVAQVACFGTVTATSAPFIACSKVSDTSARRSRPRTPSAWPPRPRVKNVEKMSPMSEANPPPKLRGSKPPPESYALRFSGSESVS